MPVHVPDPGSDTTVLLELNGRRVVDRILIACLAIEASFVLMDATLNHADWLPYSSLRRFVNTTREDALPSFFGVTQSVLIGLLVFAIAWVHRAQGAPRRTVRGWVGVASLFTYVAIDDGTMLHERIGSTLQDMAAGESGRLAFFPSYPWQVVFVPVLGALGLAALVFLVRQLSDRQLRAAMAASFALLALAVGMDFLEGLPEDHPMNPYRVWGSLPAIEGIAQVWFHQSGYDAILHFSKSIEETLEMAAMSVFGWAFGRHLVAQAPRIRLRL